MNRVREHLVTCSPKVKSEIVKQNNTQTVSISEDKPRVSTTLKWLKVTNLLMLLSNSACLATLPGPVQQQNDRMGKNKSTKLSQPSGQIWKEKAKQSIHLTQALCNNYGIGFYFHLKVPLSGVKYKASKIFTLRKDTGVLLHNNNCKSTFNGKVKKHEQPH